MPGLANNYDNITLLDLTYNQISSIESGSFDGLTNLTYLSLMTNQIETLNLSGSNLPSLGNFEIRSNPLKNVLLANATLSQRTFNTLMNAGHLMNFGIAELGGVLSLDMSGVDFVDISDLSAMYTMDDLEELFLIDAINLDGGDVVGLVEELYSLDWLDVTGTWDMFDPVSQVTLIVWDEMQGNTLIIPEPCTLVLLGLGGLVLRRKKA